MDKGDEPIGVSVEHWAGWNGWTPGSSTRVVPVKHGDTWSQVRARTVGEARANR